MRSQKNSEIGLPHIQNYSPDEYGAFDQNWDAVQDSRGILHFANGDGVLSYDGVTWDLVELPNKASVFSLAINDKDEIYVGAGNELGYLESDSIGRLTYVSLLPKLPKKYHDFGQIFSLQSKKNELFFGSKKYLFKWNGTQFQVWENYGDSTFHSVGNKLFKIRKNGLTEFKNNDFELIPKGEFFADKRIFAILSFNKTDYLFVTKNKIYLYNGKTIVDFKTDAPDFFIGNTIYRGIQLSDDTYALGSLKKGVLIFDAKGRQKNIINQENGLRNNVVLGLFQDRSGNSWVLLNSGLSKIEVNSPFSFFNKRNNAPDMVFDFQRFNETFYAGGPEGLFFLKSDTANAQFKLARGDYGMVWDLLVFQDKMLVGESTGIYEIDQFGKSKKVMNETTSYLHQSKTNPNRVFIGNDEGITSMYYENNIWTLENKIEKIHHTVSHIVENKNGDLWLSLDSNHIAKISFEDQSQSNLKNPTIQIFGPENGLPDSVGKVYIINDDSYFAAKNEVYKYDDKLAQFANDKKLFDSLRLGDKNVRINNVDANGNIWLIEFEDENRIDQIIATPKKNGTYDVKYLDEGRIMDKRKYGFFAEFKDSIIWYKGKPGIVKHDLKIKNTSLKDRAHISKVLLQGDSLLFGGYTTSIVHQLTYKNNQLRFQFANPSFYDESKNQFQYKLEGFDEDWSEWTLESKKDYTNIPEGDYSFKVRSKNTFNQISQEDNYSFSVLPPWHRTWWAYLIYSLGIITLVSLIIKWRSKELQRKNENLENVVAERTTEIRHKNELLNHQTEQLEKLNDSKTRLYSNITHEFRTPLTVILGMTETLKTNVKDNQFEGAEKSLEMIRRNGKNLLQLVNEMLDLAKVESGTMELNMVQTDAIPFIKYLSESFHSLAEAKKINLTVYSEIDTLEMDIDVNKMASIISNLLSNAVKFTPANGKIIVHLNKTQANNNEYLVIKVQDNGKGLAKNDITHLFDRFYQAESESSLNQQGTGIGLSLVKEFVELMDGTIAVESTLGKGTTFAVKIPVTNRAAKIVDTRTNVETPIKTSLLIDKEEAQLETYPELPLVLIIEDNIDVAHYLKTCLKGKYNTLHAIDGDLGLKMAYENIPDIIISDVMMPKKDGFEVCATLKSDERTDHIPVILLTAKVTTEDRLAGLTHGADAYLAKPFNEKELFIRLNHLVLLRNKLITKIQKEDLNIFLSKQAENPETKFLQKVINLINENLSNSAFGTNDLANKLHLSESQIYRKLKAITNKSTAVFIRSIRLQNAKKIIETSDKTISEVAYEVGFNDPSWFSRAFKEEFGFSPSEINK